MTVVVVGISDQHTTTSRLVYKANLCADLN